MKTISAVIMFPLVLAACTVVYDSLPEPELPIVYIEFDKALYDSAEKTIYLNFRNPGDWEGMYATYNRDEYFRIADYLIGEKPGNIRSTVVSNTEIAVKLAENAVKPARLFFNTQTPCYLYRSQYYIEAKAYIKTTELDVTDTPPAP